MFRFSICSVVDLVVVFQFFAVALQLFTTALQLFPVAL